MILSDREIVERVRSQRMIEPFVDHQVVVGVVSYGLSSYGYDFRVADEFRVFRGAGEGPVDPKGLDDRAFVYVFTNDVCVIPPNSFALARSLEYFRIPRDILTITLGKSTYARCFRGDTKVALVDGTSPTLEEMAERYENGEMFWGYSVGNHGRIIVTLLDEPRYIGRDSLLEITLDNGKVIYCTPDHQFIRRDGQMVAAHNMRPGDSLMPLYRQLARGYEMVYQPINGHLYPTHRLSDEWNLRNGIYEDIPGTHRHHVDRNRLNNAPWNIVRMDASEHVRDHNEDTFGEDFDPEEHSAAIREAFARLSQDVEWYERFCDAQRDRAVQFWNAEKYAGRLLQCDRSVFRRFPEVIREFKGRKRNHKVVSIRGLPGDHDVYCLTVPEAGNFALEAGVFVHNCGILLNVTPLEPEWEGHITLAIVNTTPLPARIYANEGIGQIVFLRASELCRVSYADRKGRYQEQRGIVLPKVG